VQTEDWPTISFGKSSKIKANTPYTALELREKPASRSASTNCLHTPCYNGKRLLLAAHACGLLEACIAWVSSSNVEL